MKKQKLKSPVKTPRKESNNMPYLRARRKLRFVILRS